jgi:hypothetical protein
VVAPAAVDFDGPADDEVVNPTGNDVLAAPDGIVDLFAFLDAAGANRSAADHPTAD